MTAKSRTWYIRLRGYFYSVGPMHFAEPVGRRAAMRRARETYGSDLEGVYPA